MRDRQRALDVNPNLVSIESAPGQLRELLRQRRRDTIEQVAEPAPPVFTSSS